MTRRGSRRGKRWEYSVRKMLTKDFVSDSVFKLINTEHMDFLVFYVSVNTPAVALVEAKSTRLDHYYALSDEKRRVQWRAYFDAKAALEMMGFPVSVYLYLKKPDGVYKILIESYEDIQTKY